MKNSFYEQLKSIIDQYEASDGDSDPMELALLGAMEAISYTEYLVRLAKLERTTISPRDVVRAAFLEHKNKSLRYLTDRDPGDETEEPGHGWGV